MKKITKAILIILLSIIMSATSILPAFASEEVSYNTSGGISPRLSHTATSNFSFYASENGAEAYVSYDGLSSFARADITIKVEKRFLLAFWNDIGEWSASSTDVNGDFYHVFQLNGRGTYRATFTLTITGTDGTVDTLTEEIKSKY